jgi:hypothetical protein
MVVRACCAVRKTVNARNARYREAAPATVQDDLAALEFDLWLSEDSTAIHCLEVLPLRRENRCFGKNIPGAENRSPQWTRRI